MLIILQQHFQFFCLVKVEKSSKHLRIVFIVAVLADSYFLYNAKLGQRATAWSALAAKDLTASAAVML